MMTKVILLLKKWHKERYDKAMYAANNLQAHEYLKMNPMPELSDEDIKTIDDYWAQYGIKYRDYSWFQWLSGIRGGAKQPQVDPRFIPKDVYKYIIWPYYNHETYCHAWKDKNYFERFLPGVPFPRVILKKIHGKFYDRNDKYYSNTKEIIKLLMNEGEVIVKDALDSGEGRGVAKYQIATEEDGYHLLSEWESDNYIIQEVVQQHPLLTQFNESSVNPMRISSWYHDGKVEILGQILRIGTPGYVTDICFIDGIETVKLVGITMDGYFKDTVMTHDGRKEKISDIVANPTERIPCWDEIISIIKENHPKLGHFDIVGWDFTVTRDGKPICIEYNIRRPGIIFSQYGNGPFFGDHTDQVLKFLKDKKNQEKYIPKWLRIH